MENEHIYIQPILKGKIIHNPEYIEQEVEEYKYNPCIEALPPIFDDEYVVDRLATYLRPKEHEKNQNENVRYHFLKRIKNYYQPLSIHLKIEHILSCLIRRSYIARNPSSKEYYLRLRLILETIEEKNNKNLNSANEVCNELYSKLREIPESRRSTAECTSIIGISGMGKSTAIEKLLKMYPQVIIHKNYRGKPLTRTQITWLKIDCPYDGSIKTLCKMFFKALDEVLLTSDYFRIYGTNKNSAATMMIHMSHLACLHSIGILVIDEMQHLINPKNKPDDVLNFLVTLVNMIGVSVVQIGTPKVTNVINKGLREIRRAEEGGAVFWDRMKEDEEWDFFLENMWECQWVKNFTPLDDELKKTMYYESQGITSIAISLFILVQTEAIFSTKEKITAQLIHRVAEHDLRLTNKVISALRNNKISEISNYEDITIEIENILQNKINNLEYRERVKEIAKKHKEAIINKSNNVKDTITGEIVSMGLFSNLDYNKIEEIAENVIKKQMPIENVLITKQKIIKLAMIEEEKIAKEKIEKNNRKERNNIKNRKDLRYLFNLSKKNNIHIYEVLKSNSYIKDTVHEFYNKKGGRTDSLFSRTI